MKRRRSNSETKLTHLSLTPHSDPRGASSTKSAFEEAKTSGPEEKYTDTRRKSENFERLRCWNELFVELYERVALLSLSLSLCFAFASEIRIWYGFLLYPSGVFGIQRDFGGCFRKFRFLKPGYEVRWQILFWNYLSVSSPTYMAQGMCQTRVTFQNFNLTIFIFKNIIFFIFILHVFNFLIFFTIYNSKCISSFQITLKYL